MKESIHIFYICPMPLILQKEIANNTLLGIWKIKESPEWFRTQLKLNHRENAVIDTIKHPLKKLHWLSSRVLVRVLMNNPEEFIHLESDERGKPMIQNFPVKISISHSHELSALLLSTKYDVGIDIEKIDPKIVRIKNKFLAEEELQRLEPKHELKQLYVYWCAKEAMYKLHGRKQLDFREHLSVSPFTVSDHGKIEGKISKDDFKQQLEISFERINEYMLAYVSAS